MSQPGARRCGSYDRRVPSSPSTRRPVVRLLWLVPLVIALSAVSSCGDQAHTSGVPGAGQAIGGALERRSSPASHLLAADKMPTPGAPWSATQTVNDDFSVLGPCHLASLTDIGAVATARRTWSMSSALPRATQVVARFADGKSAWRAHQVLGSWRERCADQVDGHVGPMRSAPVPKGVGEAYRVDNGDTATDLGILRKGAYLSVVVLDAAPSQLPRDSSVSKTALRRIAATF